MSTINCNGTLIDLSQPRIMGIMNMTPDSFYEGGRTLGKREIAIKASELIHEGAAIIDIGGYSSRPGAKEISQEEEIDRVLPAIALIKKEFPNVILSIDTFRSEVAKVAVQSGASIVNDISGGLLDEAMLPTVAKLQVPYILMHMKGDPQTMSQHAQYKNLMGELLYYFSERVAKARAQGISDIIIDPGFGFAKTREHNFELLHSLDLLKQLDLPFLVGISRKSMIYKTLGTEPEEALNGTTVLHTVALLKGASILRVHDVKEASECVKLLQKLQFNA